MNQKENFINFLMNSTHEHEIVWQNTNVPASLYPYVINSDMVSQVFCSNIKANDIYFIIQKYISYSHDFDQHYEQFSKFLLVLNNNKLVYSVYEDEISENMLDALLEEIREKMENDFYEKFMKKFD
jgi:hypothetical protein